MLHLLNMNIQEKAAEYVSLYNDLRRIALKLRPIEERFLGMDGLGSAGMQVEGVYDEYMRESGYRTNIVEQLKKVRAEVGENNRKEFEVEIRKNSDGEKAAEYYIQTAPRNTEPEKSFLKRLFK